MLLPGIRGVGAEDASQSLSMRVRASGFPALVELCGRLAALKRFRQCANSLQSRENGSVACTLKRSLGLGAERCLGSLGDDRSYRSTILRGSEGAFLRHLHFSVATYGFFGVLSNMGGAVSGAMRPSQLSARRAGVGATKCFKLTPN